MATTIPINEGRQAAVRALASTLVSRLDFAKEHGYQYGTDRDLYATLGYKRDLQVSDYRASYERGALGARIVDAKPKATWRDLPEVRSNADAKRLTEFDRAWEELVERLNLLQTFERLDRLMGLGEYAILVLGGRVGALESPLDQGARQELVWVHPYAEDHVSILEWDESPNSPRFGLPTLYEVKQSQRRTDRNSAKRRVKVHHSRVLHVAEDTLDNVLYGRPRLRNVFNLMDDLIKVVGGSSEGYWRGGYPGLHADVDKDLNVAPELLEELGDEIDKYVHGMQRFVKTRGVDMKVLQGVVGDPRGAFEVISSLIASACEIPKRILFGSERGELASRQDRDNWDDRIAERRKTFVESAILRPFVTRGIETGFLPPPSNGTFVIRWGENLRLPEDERAQNAERLANAMRRFEEARLASGRAQVPTSVTLSEFRRDFLGLPADPPGGFDEVVEATPDTGAGTGARSENDEDAEPSDDVRD